MTSVNLKLGLTLLLALTITSCAQVKSEHIATSQIYSDYSATYSERANTLTIDARFQVGQGVATQVRLSGQSRVAVNGLEMTEQPSILGLIIYRAVIEKVTAEQLNEVYRINYHDNDGKLYQNVFTIPQKVFVYHSRAFSAETGFKVNWYTENILQPDEEVHFIFQSEGSDIVNAETRKTLGTKTGSIFMKPQPYPKGGNQDVTATIIRTKRYATVQAPAVGGSLQVQYSAAPVTIRVREKPSESESNGNWFFWK